MIQIKRIYEPAESADGVRVLVDRLWPRGVSKSAAKIDAWMKDVAPTPALRTWFGHEPTRFLEFRRRYEKELAGMATQCDDLRKLAGKKTLTLVYAARDEVHNHAVVLRDYLMRRHGKRRSRV